MAAAYAALVSLMNTVDAVQNHPRLFTSLDKYQTRSLKEKLDSLLQFVEDYDFRGGRTKDAVEDLKSQIGSAAHAAEVVVEAHIADRIITEPSFDLQQMVRVMISLIKKFEYLDGKAIKEEAEYLKNQIESAAHAADVMISVGAKESAQGSITQGITTEAVEDLKTRFASAVHAAQVVLRSSYDHVHFCRRHFFEEPTSDLQEIIEDIGFLMKKVNYVKEQRKHEHYYDEEQSLDLQKMIVDMGSLMDKVNNVKEQMRHEEQAPTYSMPTATPSRS